MKKSLFLSLMFFCFTATSLFADGSNDTFMKCFQKAENLKKQGISYDVSSTTGKKKKKSVSATIYMKGDKIRVESPEGATIIDVKSNEMYVYSEKDKTAIKMALNMDQVQQTTLEVSQEKADELTYVKEDTKNGYACKVFKAKDGKKEVEYYMTNDYGFPTYVKEPKAESNITNFKVGSIKDSLFELPKDVNVTDMGNLSSFSSSLSDDVNKKVKKDKSNGNEKAKSFLKNTADETVVGGAKEGVQEMSEEEKSQLKQETKEKTKKALKGFLGI